MKSIPKIIAINNKVMKNNKIQNQIHFLMDFPVCNQAKMLVITKKVQL